jgi:hypothetical protein
VGQVGQVEDALVGFPIAADGSGMVNSEDHRQVLQAYIVYYLVVSAL